MDTVSLAVSEGVEFDSGKAACIERTCLGRQVQRELYEATVVGNADVAAHADRLAILKGDFAYGTTGNAAHYGICDKTPAQGWICRPHFHGHGFFI